MRSLPGAEPSQSLKGGTNTHFRPPKLFAISNDFELWLKRFESYVRCVGLPNEAKGDALLMSLDERAFRTADQLGLDPETQSYSTIRDKLLQRFASRSSEPELRFELSQRRQQPEESLEDFAGVLVDLAARGHRNLGPTLQDSLARDRFIAGISSEYIQDRLLTDAPETLDEALQLARRLEMAKLARERMRKGSKDGPAQPQKPESPVSDKEVAAVGSTQVQHQSSLCEAVRANTEALRTLMDQLSLTREANPARAMEGGRSRNRRRPAITCWNCGEEGHRRSVCPQRDRQASQSSSGNENGLAPRARRQPQNQW